MLPVWPHSLMTCITGRRRRHIVYSKNSGMSVGDLQTVDVQGTDHFALLGTWVIE